MLFRLAADAVVIVHLLWIVFLVLGAWPGRRVAWVKWLHGGALTFSILLQLCGWVCPLTHLEVWLRARADSGGGYTGDFLAHYAEQLVYLTVPPHIVLLATLVIIGLSIWAYWPKERRERAAPHHPDSQRRHA
jgi:polyferredoxin